MSSFVGYFDHPAEPPIYDPPLDSPCVVCGVVMLGNRITISLAPVGGRRSYFFRAHKACWESLSEEDQAQFESSIIDEPPTPAGPEVRDDWGVRVMNSAGRGKWWLPS